MRKISPEAYARKATAESINASIPGFKSVPGINIRSLPKGHGIRFEKIDIPFVRNRFDGPFYVALTKRRDIPTVSAVFAADKNGNTIPPSEEPRELGAGNTDFHFIYHGAGVSMTLADGALMGANTIRGANKFISLWHPETVAYRESIGKPRHPAQIIATRSGNLDISRNLIFNAPELRVFILTTHEGARSLAGKMAGRNWIKVIPVGDESNIEFCLQILKREYGMEMVTVIGGKDLVDQMGDLVRNFYLTKSGIVAGLPNTEVLANIPKVLVLQKKGWGKEEGVTFQHFVIQQ